MKCPACQAAVHHRQIQDGLARCQWCNHVWDSLMAGDERLMRKFASEEVVRYVAEAIADTVDGSVRITRC